MGKKSRRARSDQPARVKRKPVPFVERPFDGLSAEADLVAMREILPAATITATTTADHGSRTVTFVTLLPQIWAALARDDGEILVALQTNERSGDASRDAAAALLAALDAEPGTDFHTVQHGGVSITPLRLDLTDHAQLDVIGQWAGPLCANR